MAATNVDENEFPIVCETCLGPNPYVRMLEDKVGRECKVCERPFRCFSWRPGGHGMRGKKTEICQTCARVKNVCQTCLLDLKYNVPVAIRDLSLSKEDKDNLASTIPLSEATREYSAVQHDRLLKTDGDKVSAIYEKELPEDSLPVKASRKRAAQRDGNSNNYDRNRARICTFYLKDKCTRGLYCPYRHEKAVNVNIDDDENTVRDRYYGRNDSVATRMIQKISGSNPDMKTLAMMGNAPPENKDIRTLFVGGITAELSEHSVREFFGSMKGDIEHIKLIPARGFGFVDFQTRAAAEKAMSYAYGMRRIASVSVTFKWGRATLNRDKETGRIIRPREGDPADEMSQPKRLKTATQ